VDVRTRRKVTKIGYGNDGRAVESVTYEHLDGGGQTETIQATDVVVAAGPWTPSVFPPAPISALRAHSVTIRPSRPVSAYALFTQIRLPAGFGQTDESLRSRKNGKSGGSRAGWGEQIVSPEIYARPKNEVYACGEGDRTVPLPAGTQDVEVDESRCQDIVDYVSSISDELRDGEVTARQACYLPNVSSGSGHPLVGLTGVKGLVLAAGHTCWGIQNGPGTGKLVSEFVWQGEARSAKVKGLDPRNVL
jgi:glycine/D-amino acid oxidase-like deaminating enzyme